MEGASERKKRWRRGDACAPNSGGTSRNEMHGNIRIIYTYISRSTKETPKEVRRRKRERKRVGGDREGRQRKGEKVRKGGIGGRNSDSRDARTAASLWCAKLPRDI